MERLEKLVPTEHQTYMLNLWNAFGNSRIIVCLPKKIHMLEETSEGNGDSSNKSKSDTEIIFIVAVLDKNIPISNVKLHLQSAIMRVRKIVNYFEYFESKITSFMKKLKNSTENKFQLSLAARKMEQFTFNVLTVPIQRFNQEDISTQNTSTIQMMSLRPLKKKEGLVKYQP